MVPESIEITVSNFTEKYMSKIKGHIVNSTAILAVTTPVYAGLETLISGMTNEASINARTLAAATIYGGLGFVIAKGREIYQGILDIDKTSERLIRSHDRKYAFLFNIASSPFFYWLAGSKNLKEIAIGSVGAGLVGYVTGDKMGYAMDAYKDLVGIEKSERLPIVVSKLNKKNKLLLAASLTALSLGTTYGIYQLNNSTRLDDSTNGAIAYNFSK
jgi:hypothetical protein